MKMKLAIIAATKFDHEPYEEEVKDFAGKCARVCYLPGSLDKVLASSMDVNLRVAEQTLASGHHSVYDHTYVNLALEGIPKILAMVLNNEHAYTTSEQSGRYTKLAACGVAAELYQKWLVVLQDLIAEQLPDLASKKVEKLAMENARYFLSVFAPTTTMIYTCSVRQLNYIYHWMTRFCASKVMSDFEQRLQGVLLDFCLELREQAGTLIIPGLADNKLRGLSLCTEWRKRRLLEAAATNGCGLMGDPSNLINCDEPEEWGERTYSTNYWGSFAQLAQAHRHRTLHYEMRIPEAALADFYVPPILPDELVEEWLDDMELMRYEYPQGMLVWINESGRLEDLVQKCQERICGEAQLEICAQTLETVTKYYQASMWNGGRWSNPFVSATLWPYAHVHGCKRVQLSGARCLEPCIWLRTGYEIEERFL